MSAEIISIGIGVLAFLVVLVNVITQVFKGFTYNKIPTRVVAVIVAVVLSVSLCVALCQIYSIAVLWYYIAAAIVVGFIAAYGAMYGYDTLYKELWEAIKNVKKL